LSTVAAYQRTGLRTSGVCAGTMIFNSQTEGTFSGTVQLLSPCGQSGTVNGELDSAGRILRFGFSQTVGPGVACEYVSGDRGLTGTLSGSSITLQATQTVSCLGELVDRNQVLTATRQ
jgi:hypothetical protein